MGKKIELSCKFESLSFPRTWVSTEHDCKEQNIMGMCFELLQKLNSTAAIGEVYDMMILK